MATWSTKSALLGSSESDSYSTSTCLSSPSSPPATPTTTSCLSSPSSPPATPTTATPTTVTPPTTPSPTLDDCMDDSGFQDWMEMQLGVTGEMTVVERLQHLLDTGQFADINVRVGQGNNAALFKAHRLLLATASQPLYRLVQQGASNSGVNDICTLRITDMKPADFECILKYIYTDQVECENINVAFGLLRASRKWGLAGLGIKSLTYLEEFVDNFTPTTDDAKDNLFDLLALSEDTLSELSTKCYQIINKNAEELIPCNGYLNLDKPMVEKVLLHPDLKIEDQLKLFEAIRDWGLHYIQQHNLPITALGTVVEEIIKIVDFQKINDSDFLSTVLTSECLGKAEVIAFFMTHGLEIPRKLDFNNNKELPFWLTFAATSNRTKTAASRGGGRSSKRPSVSSSSSSLSSLAPVSEAHTSICSLTQNGSVLEFNKVCRFKKGYRCPPKEIYMQHELRFRVDKNVKLLGVGFGFLFTATDMGLNLHCQGPWETRQWTDIIQSYVRVPGEKQETADVRLMFLHPVRIEANQSYKVVVKMVRMSHGSNEVELWGGAGGVASVETEDAEFNFIKAAVDPDKPVEESDGDTSPGVITALLYRLDTDEPDPHPASTRRRRPVQSEEEVTSPPAAHSNPWRHRSRPDSLKIPETPYTRKRSPATDSTSSSEAPPPVRRRERPPPEEYKPTSFSTNRWRTKPKEEEKPSSDDYVPSTFSTNRWARTRPKEDSTSTTDTKTERKKPSDDYVPSTFSTNRWARPQPKEDSSDAAKSQTGRKTSVAEDYTPSSFSTNRWARPKEEKTETQSERKTSAPEPYKPVEEYKPSSFSTNRWARPKEEKMETPTERKTSAPEPYKPSSFSTNRWARSKEEKTETQTERKASTTEEYKPSSFATSRFRNTPKETTTTSDTSHNTSAEESRLRTRPQDEVKDTPFGMRVRSNSRVEEPPSSHPFARRRESRDTSSDVPFYLRKTEDVKPPTAPLGRSRWGGSATSSTTGSSSTPSSSSNSTSTSSSSKLTGETPFQSRFLRSSGSSSSPYSSSRFGSVRESSLTRSSLPRFAPGSSYLSRYDSTSNSSPSRPTDMTSRYGSGEGRASSPPAPRKNLRYGSSITSSGSNLLALSSSSFGLGAGGGSSARASPRPDASTGSRAVDRDAGSGTSLGRYGSGSTPGSTSSSRYGRSSTPSGSTSSRYGATGTSGSSVRGSGSGGLGGTTADRYSVSGSLHGSSSSYGAKTPSGTTGRYTSRDSTGSTGRYCTSGSSAYGTTSNKYGSSATADTLSSRGSGMSSYSRGSVGMGQGSRYGLSRSSAMYSSPASTSSLGR